MHGENVSSTSLIMAHAHYTYLYKEFLESTRGAGGKLRLSSSQDEYSRDDIESSMEAGINLNGDEE